MLLTACIRRPSPSHTYVPSPFHTFPSTHYPYVIGVRQALEALQQKRDAALKQRQHRVAEIEPLLHTQRRAERVVEGIRIKKA